MGPPSGSADVDVMISYRVPETGKDADGTAPALAELLVAAGYTVFLDVDHLHDGVDWDDEIGKAVQSCRAFVAIISTTYGDKQESRYTYKDFKLAVQLDKDIVPVFHSGDWPKPSLALHTATMQYVPKTGAMLGRTLVSAEQVAPELITALKARGVNPSKQPPGTAPVSEAPTVLTTANAAATATPSAVHSADKQGALPPTAAQVPSQAPTAAAAAPSAPAQTLKDTPLSSTTAATAAPRSGGQAEAGSPTLASPVSFMEDEVIGPCTWEQLHDVIDEAREGLRAAGLPPAVGFTLQLLGYTQSTDLQHLTDQEVEAVCKQLTAEQAGVLKALARPWATTKGAVPAAASAGQAAKQAADAAAQQGACWSCFGSKPSTRVHPAPSPGEGLILASPAPTPSPPPLPPISARMQAVRQPTLLPAEVFEEVKDEWQDVGDSELHQLLEGCGGVSGLVAQLSRGTEEGKEQAAWALKSLLVSSLVDIVLAARPFAPLLALVSRNTPCPSAALALSTLIAHMTWCQKAKGGEAEETNSQLPSKFLAAVDSAFPVEALTTQLCSSSLTDQEHAAGRLRNVAAGFSFTHNFSTLAVSAALPHLVALLETGSPAAKDSALEVVSRLATNGQYCSEDVREVLQSVGVVELLVPFLSSDSPALQEKAARTLGGVAEISEEMRADIRRSGGLQQLAALLTNKEVPQVARAAAVSALRRCDSELIKVLSSDADQLGIDLQGIDLEAVIAALAAMLPDKAGGPEAADILCKLYNSQVELKARPNLQSKVDAAINVRAWVAQLGSGLASEQAEAARALCSIVQASGDFMVKVQEAGSIPLLMALMSADNHGVQGDAIHTMTVMWCRDAADSINAIGPLVKLLSNPSPEIRGQAAKALGTLADNHSELCGPILSAGAAKLLLSLLRNSRRGVQEEAARALRTLIENGEREDKDDPSPERKQLVASGAMVLLVTYLSSACVSQWIAAADLLHGLVYKSQYLAAKVITAGAIPRLTAMLLRYRGEAGSNSGSNGGLAANNSPAPAGSITVMSCLRVTLKAAEALTALATSIPDSSKALADTGVVPASVAILSMDRGAGSSIVLRWQVAGLLLAMSKSSADVQGRVVAAGAVPALKVLLQHPQHHDCIDAWELLLLTGGAAALMEQVPASGSLTPLVELMDRCGGEPRRQVVMVFRQLFDGSKAADRALASKFVDKLLSQANYGEADKRQEAQATLQLLLDGGEALKKAVVASAAPDLVERLRKGYRVTKEGLELLQTIVCSREGQDLVAEASTALVKALKGRPVETTCHIVDAIQALASSNAKCKSTLVAAGAVDAIRDSLARLREYPSLVKEDVQVLEASAMAALEALEQQ